MYTYISRALAASGRKSPPAPLSRAAQSVTRRSHLINFDTEYVTYFIDFMVDMNIESFSLF